MNDIPLREFLENLINALEDKIETRLAGMDKAMELKILETYRKERGILLVLTLVVSCAALTIALATYLKN